MSATKTGNRAAVSLVVSPGGRLLCVWSRRYVGWTLPGGMVEQGETIEQAQARELREETGLETIEATKLYDAPHASKQLADRGAHVHVFLVRTRGQARAMEEGCPVAWLTREEYLAKTAFKPFYAACFKALPWPLTPKGSRRCESYEEFCRRLEELGLRQEVHRLALARCATVYQLWERNRLQHVVDVRKAVYEMLALDYGWGRQAIADLFGRDQSGIELPRRRPVIIPGMVATVVEEARPAMVNGTNGGHPQLPAAASDPGITP